VFTILVDETRADGQQSTLHFKYLLDEHGGWVTVSPTLEDHERRLASMLDARPRTEAVQAAVMRFVRPSGWTTPASHVMVEAIETRLSVGPVFQTGQADAHPAPERERITITAPAPTRRLPSGESARVVPVEYDGPALWVAVSNDEEAAQARIASRAPFVVERLPDLAATGRPLYIIGADSSAVALIGARALGATVFAFESDIPSLARLWDNILLNDCEGNLVPVPMAIGSKRVLEEQRSDTASPGAPRGASRRRVWREHPGSPRLVLQPRLALPLDTAIKTWTLPAPHAIYVGPLAVAADVVLGAEKALQTCAAVMIDAGANTPPASRSLAEQALTAAGFSVRARSPQPGHAVLFAR
jgi:hypothetical protein